MKKLISNTMNIDIVNFNNNGGMLKFSDDIYLNMNYETFEHLYYLIEQALFPEGERREDYKEYLEDAEAKIEELEDEIESLQDNDYDERYERTREFWRSAL